MYARQISDCTRHEERSPSDPTDWRVQMAQRTVSRTGGSVSRGKLHGKRINRRALTQVGRQSEMVELNVPVNQA